MHNEKDESRINKILGAGVIVSATSAWSLPVVNTTRKDGKPRCFVNYQLLNERKMLVAVLLQK